VGATTISLSSFTAVAIALLVLIVSGWRQCSGFTTLPSSIPPLIPHLFSLLSPLPPSLPLQALQDGHWAVIHSSTIVGDSAGGGGLTRQHQVTSQHA